MNIDTLCVCGDMGEGERFGAVAVPIYQSATFAHPAVGSSTGYDYSRTGNPTRDAAERHIAALDGVKRGFGFATGMAAVCCVMELFKPGDAVYVADDLYGGTVRLFDNISRKNGVIIKTFEAAEQLEGIEAAAIFIETPTNPMMNVIDIKKCAGYAKAAGALLIVDNTFLTPVFQRPFELGADITLYSGTKYLGGHNDTLAGFLTTDDDAIAERLAFIHKTTGACLSPFDSFLITRGLKTLSLRVRRQSESAIVIANKLKAFESVTDVYYPGLPESPGYELSKRQTTGFGGMISFRVKDEGAAVHALNSVKLIKYAESLGGADSLITYPALQTHADVPVERRLAKGIDGRLLRLSVGIEDAADLTRDLEGALTLHG